MESEHKPFYPTRLEEEKAGDQRKIFTLSLNLDEYAQLQEDKRVLEQAKDSTAIKQLWQLGRNVLHDQQTGLIIRSILRNRKNNRRAGIMDIESELPANVTQK